MANIKKGARAYYADTDYKRDGMIEAYGKIDSLPAIPTPETTDEGKILKVNESGSYELADDAGTVLPTPGAEDVGKVVKVNAEQNYALGTDEGLPAVTSSDNGKVLTVVNGIWSPELKIRDIDTISAMKITISNGGSNSACLPPLTFNDPITGEVANLVVNTDYTMECSSSIVTGSLTLTGAPDVANANLPAVFDIDFINEVNIRKYSNIKMTNAVAFTYSLAKNIKIEVSTDGESYITVYDETTLDWTVSPKEFNIYGDPISTLPIPTIADAGKVLSVDNSGKWELDNIPSELPTVTSADAGKALTVDSNGDWGVANVGESDLYIITAKLNASETFVSLTYPNGDTIDSSTLINAIKNKKLPICKLIDASNNVRGYAYISGRPNAQKATFTEEFNTITNTITVHTFSVISSGSTSYTSYQIAFT